MGTWVRVQCRWEGTCSGAVASSSGAHPLCHGTSQPLWGPYPHPSPTCEETGQLTRSGSLSEAVGLASGGGRVTGLALTRPLSGHPWSQGRGDAMHTAPAPGWGACLAGGSQGLQPPRLLAWRPGVGRAGGQLLGPRVSSGAGARPGHFLCAL